MENQPSESIDKELSIPSEVVLADPKFGQPRRIDLLLGVEIYSRLIRPGLIELGTDMPTLQETTFFWIVFGAVRRRLPAAILEISQQKHGRIRYQHWKYFGSQILLTPRYLQ